MDRNHAMKQFIGQRVANLENTKYIKRALKKYQVENISELPIELQISIEREAAYLRGVIDGIQLGSEIKKQCPIQKNIV